MFSNFFGGSNKNEPLTNNINWKSLMAADQLYEIVELSHQKPVFIFKHSTRCIVSRTVLKQFENEFIPNQNVEAYFLDLLNYREISDEIASRFGVTHQSPQLILIQNGTVVYHVSHESIDAAELTINFNFVLLNYCLKYFEPY